jgi:hypothetical protein
MSTAAQLVTRAYRRLQAIDINEEPSDSEMVHGLAVMSEMVNAWTVKGIPTDQQLITGDLAAGDDLVRNVSDMSGILIGLNVDHAAIPSGAYVKEVLTDTTFRMSQNASSGAGSAQLTITFLPMQVKYEAAAVALLAVRLSEDLGIAVTPKLLMDANDGWADILAGHIPDRRTVFDRAIAGLASVDLVLN